jgi:hypothetical protein
MRSKSQKVANPKREALQQYWHEGGSTGIYARATLRTLQFSSAIIAIGIYGSSLHQRSQASNPITNEIYALVVGLLSVFTLGVHCLFTIKRVPFVLWDFVVCVLWAALAGVYGTIYLAGGDLAQEDRVKSLDAMKVGVAFDLLSMVFWLLSAVARAVLRARPMLLRWERSRRPVVPKRHTQAALRLLTAAHLRMSRHCMLAVSRKRRMRDCTKTN